MTGPIMAQLDQVKGRADKATEGPSTLPEKFRDPSALAKFVIENEWALDSESDPNVRADWYETLHRVFDTWDADTPEDIVSAIAAAIRLDRDFRDFREENERIRQAPPSLKDLEAAWEAAEQADECRKGDVMIVRHSRGEYTIWEAECGFQLETTARILSRAPQRESLQDLADAIREALPSAYDENDIGPLAYALHKLGVGLPAQAESEGGA